MTIKRLFLALLVAAAGALSAVAIAACDDNDEVTADSDEEVQIRITDTVLDPERVEVRPGTIRFLVDNDSDQTHELAVETPNGVEQSGAIEPGDSGSVTVELDEGEYEMYDPLKNYRERGVEGVVVVSGDTDTVTEEDTDTVTEEDTDTVTEEDTDTVTREDTDTVTREDTDTVTRQETVTEQETVPPQQTTPAP